MRIRELARLLRTDPAGLFRTVDHFIRLGVMVKREVAARHVQLNREFVAFTELKRLLVRLADEYSTPGAPEVRHRWYFLKHDRPLEASRHETLFGSKPRTRTLLAVGSHEGVDLMECSFVAGIYASVVNAVDHFERERIIRTARTGRSRRLYLNRDFVAFEELKALLKKLYGEYK